MRLFLELLLFLATLLYSYLEALVKLFVPVRRKSLSGELVLVTGAAHGVGRATALEFARRQSRLVLWDVNKVTGPPRPHRGQGRPARRSPLAAGPPGAGRALAAPAAGDGGPRGGCGARRGSPPGGAAQRAAACGGSRCPGRQLPESSSLSCRPRPPESQTFAARCWRTCLCPW